jgi:hypothetical protein
LSDIPVCVDSQNQPPKVQGTNEPSHIRAKPIPHIPVSESLFARNIRLAKKLFYLGHMQANKRVAAKQVG